MSPLSLRTARRIQYAEPSPQIRVNNDGNDSQNGNWANFTQMPLNESGIHSSDLYSAMASEVDAGNPEFLSYIMQQFPET